MTLQLNPFFLACPEASVCRKSGSTWSSIRGRMVFSLLGTAVGWFTAAKYHKQFYSVPTAVGALAGLFLGTQLDAKSCDQADCKSPLGAHFPMPDFMMPTYFEQETRLLDPNRG